MVHPLRRSRTLLVVALILALVMAVGGQARARCGPLLCQTAGIITQTGGPGTWNWTIAIAFGDRLKLGNTPIRFGPDARSLTNPGVVPADGPTGHTMGSMPAGATLAKARLLSEEVLAWLKDPGGRAAPVEQAQGVVVRIRDAETALATMERGQMLGTALAMIGRLINHVDDVDSALKMTMDEAVRTLGAERGYILLDDRGKLVPRTSRNMGDMRGISTSIAETAARESKEILTTALDKLHVMAEALIKYETIDEQQLKDIMEGRTPRPPSDWDDTLTNKPPKSPSEGPSGPIGSPAGQH